MTLPDILPCQNCKERGAGSGYKFCHACRISTKYYGKYRPASHVCPGCFRESRLPTVFLFCNACRKKIRDGDYSVLHDGGRVRYNSEAYLLRGAALTREENKDLKQRERKG